MKKTPCTITSRDCDWAKVALIEHVTGVSLYTSDVAAATQLLRTNVHPDLYAAVQRLQQMVQADARHVRLVADRVGYRWIQGQYPMVSAVIDAYEHAVLLDFRETDIDAAALADAYIQIISVIALYNEHMLKTFTQAVFAVLLTDAFQTHMNALYAKKGGLVSTPSGVAYDFRALSNAVDEFIYAHQDDAHRSLLGAEHDAQRQLLVEQAAPLEPFHAVVHTSNGLMTVRIPFGVVMHDYIRHHYSVVPKMVAHPVLQQRATPIAAVTLDRALQSGVTLSLSVRVAGAAPIPVDYHLDPMIIESLLHQGSAVHSVVGLLGDIRLYPEYGYLPLGTIAIPHESLASVRVNEAVVEVHNLHPDVDLTVFG